MKERLRDKYVAFLQRLCRKELKRISKKYPQSRQDLIRYHDLMALQFINAETEAQDRLLGVSLNTAIMLENDHETRGEVQ